MQSIDFPFDKFNFNSDSIFEGLPESDISLLNKNMVTHTYKKGEILFREGSYPTGIYFIKKGKVKKYKTDKEGKFNILWYNKVSGEIDEFNIKLTEKKLDDVEVVLVLYTSILIIQKIKDLDNVDYNKMFK